MGRRRDRDDFDFDDDYEEDRPRRRSRGRDSHRTSQNTQVVVNVGGRGSFLIWHLVHGILTCLTLGLWLPVWILHFVIWISCRG